MFDIHVFYRAENGEMIRRFYEEVKAAGIIEKSRQDAGNLKYDYFFSAERENEILLVEKWESRELQKAHDGLPHLAELGKIKEKYKIQTEVERLQD